MKLELKLNMHIRNQHSRIFMCDLCGKEFKRKECLKNHSLVHVENMKRDVQCDQCSATFFFVQRLKVHIRNVHGGKQYQCDVCEMKFNSKRILREHFVLTHADKSKLTQLQCEKCTEVFYLKRQLQKHMQQHNKPLTCETCGKRQIFSC